MNKRVSLSLVTAALLVHSWAHGEPLPPKKKIIQLGPARPSTATKPEQAPAPRPAEDHAVETAPAPRAAGKPCEVKLVGSANALPSGAPTLRFRTATEDIDLKVSELPTALRDLLTSDKARNEITEVCVEPRMIDKRTELPFGVRNDCSELPLSVSALDKVADSGTDQIDFLKKIPAGTIAGFTFVTNSLSAQRGVDDKGKPKGEVRAMWPRVIRTTTNGKLSISYVCDTQNPSYGKVEVIHWDDKTKRLLTREYDFNKPRGIGPDKRIAENPQSCLECHGDTKFKETPSVKHVWPEYFFWGDCQRRRGISFYGSSDDNLGPGQFRARVSRVQLPGCDYSKDLDAVEQEKRDFENFKRLQKDNPCYNTLPYAKVDEKKVGKELADDYRFYPYADQAQKRDDRSRFDYALRTNARMTDAYGHLQAQRIAELMKSDPSYAIAKYFIAMEAAECLKPDDEKDLKSCAGFETKPAERSTSRNLNPAQKAPLLFSYGRKIGLQDSEWSLLLKPTGDPTYNYVMFKGIDGVEDGSDHGLAEVVGGEVLMDIAASNPAVAKAATGALTRGPATQFKPGFECIADLGGGVRENFRREGSELCKVLREQHQANLEKMRKDKLCIAAPPSADKKVTERKPLDAASVARGKKLVQADGKGKCVSCHTPNEKASREYPVELMFLPDDSVPSLQKAKAQALLNARVKEGNFSRVLARRVITKGDMPPDDNTLTAQEKQDIRNYFESLTPAK